MVYLPYPQVMIQLTRTLSCTGALPVYIGMYLLPILCHRAEVVALQMDPPLRLL